jgi:hypothetical protein
MRILIPPRLSPLTLEETCSAQYASENSDAYQSPCANFFAGEAANVSEMARCGGRHHSCNENCNGLPETKLDDRIHPQ